MNESPDNIYIHVPFCDGKCIYCSFYSVACSEEQIIRAYISAIAKEMTLRSNEYGRLRPRTVYIGGGTPTSLSASALESFLSTVTGRVDMSSVTEFTVEANPGTLTTDKAGILHKHGVNRLSIGAQSFDDRMLELLRRRHNASQISAAAAVARKAGLTNINIDLIAALPGVSNAEWDMTLCKAIDLAPDHLSVYCLTVEDKTLLSTMTESGAMILPDGEAQADALDMAMGILKSAGFDRYEISNYAKRGRECRHNTAFWEGEDYLGIGASASSRLRLARSSNTPDIRGYIKALDSGDPAPCETELLTAEKDVCERFAFRFRMTAPVDIEAFAGRYGVTGADLKPKWLEALHRLKSADLVSHKGSLWQVTAKGINMADHVCGELL